MKRTLAVSLLLLFVATLAFAHGGHEHVYMGTITTIHNDGSFMLKTQKDETWHIVLTDQTVLQYADGKPAKRSDLAVDKRVVVKMDKDGAAALSVKIGK
jgi:hypothetical protein